MSGKEFFKEIDTNFTKIVQLYKSLIPKPSSHIIQTELFKKLLDKDFDINYRIPDSYNVFETDWVAGCTILHLVRSIPDVYQDLIDHGADYTIMDKEGSTVLLRETTSYGCRYSTDSTKVYDETVHTGYGHYLESLSDSDLSRRSVNDKETCVNIVLSAHINSENPTNPKDKNGLSHFHVACMYNRVDVAKFFLENGVSVNDTVNSDSNFYPGFTALHFAVKSCAVEIVELLLTKGANIFAKDSKGMNPLHILMKERKKTFVKVKRHLKTTISDEPKLKPSERYAESYAWIFGNSMFTNLYKHYDKNQKIIYLLLEKMNECGHPFIDDTRLTYFHLLCFMGNTSGINEFLDNNVQHLSQSVSMDSPICPGYTPLHFAANCSLEAVELLVKRGADLNTKDAKGVTPFEICMREFSFEEVHKILLLQPDYSNIVFSDGKTKLCDFIHAMQKTATFQNFLKKNLTDPNIFIPFDAPICAGYTPLHLTLICAEQPMCWSSKNYDTCDDHMFDADKFRQYFSRIDSCLSYNPDVNSEDARGSTPLHWAFRLQHSEAVHMLLKLQKTKSDHVNEDGLSHLHIACAAGNGTVVKKLLGEGANFNEAVTSSYTWLDKEEMMSYGLGNVERQFDKYFINKGSTPLHFASIVKCPKIVDILMKHGADVLAQDVDGLNPLERLFGIPIFQDSRCPKPTRHSLFDENEEKVIGLLVRRIGDRLADTKPKQMLQCYNLLDDKMLREILSHGDKSAMKVLGSVGITPLHVACFTQNLERANKLINEIDVNARVSVESPLWPGCTPLHLFIKSATLMKQEWRVNWTIATKLLELGADVGAVNVEGETPIHEILLLHQNHQNEMLNHLQGFNVNPTNKKGFSHLHIASACGAVSIVQQLLEHGAAVDQPTDYFIKDHCGFTALHFAALYQQKDVADVLLKHGADANWRNGCGDNPLHTVCKGNRRPCLKLLQTLIGAGAEIHARNMYGETPFEALLKSSKKTHKEIGLFLEHGCRANTFDFESNEGLLARTLYKNSFQSFEMIVAKASDVKDIDSHGRNAIHNVVAFKLPDHNEGDEDDDTEDFGLDMFYEKFTPSNDYVKAIDLLIEIGVNIDQQDCEGSTPLHVAAQMQNFTGIIGLLKNGADINITDAHGNTAFAYCLKLADRHPDPGCRIIKIILSHMYKLNMAKIGISMANRQIEAKILEERTIGATEIRGYINEMERMRKEQITSTSVALCKFLSDTDAVSAFPRQQPSDKTAIESFFKNETKNLRNKFPHFAGILLLQYRKALARGDLIDRAATSLDTLVGYVMPIICKDIILKFLSNDELTNLISSVAVN